MVWFNLLRDNAWIILEMPCKWTLLVGEGRRGKKGWLSKRCNNMANLAEHDHSVYFRCLFGEKWNTSTIKDYYIRKWSLNNPSRWVFSFSLLLFDVQSKSKRRDRQDSMVKSIWFYAWIDGIFSYYLMDMSRWGFVLHDAPVNDSSGSNVAPKQQV